MFDFITVVFQVELPLLEIQARSLDLYIKPQDVNQIVIVVNDNDYVADMIDTTWWGQHSNKVVIKTTSNYDLLGTGWENQQVLKLIAASEATTTWSLVLDAKTWFIKPFESDKLFGTNGKPWVGSVPGLPNVFVQARAFVEQYYNIQMPKILGPNGVPYLFHTSSVKEMIDSIDDFIGFFRSNTQGPNFLTEFFLYSGFLISKYGSLEELHNTTHCYLFPFNLATNEISNDNDIFTKLRRYPKSILTASIHRNAYSKLSPEQLETWYNFLVERQLFPSLIETQKLLNTYIK